MDFIFVFASCSFSEISAEYCLPYFYYMMLDVFLELDSFLFKETNRKKKKKNESNSSVAQTVKILPAMQETWVQSLGPEDSLEKGIATHSSIFAWRILWTEEPDGLQSMGSQRVGRDLATNTFTYF